MKPSADVNRRPEYDQELQRIADYVLGFDIESAEAWTTARLCLMDALACGLLALESPECTKHLGPLVEGTHVPHGARVPGTRLRLDPVQAAWDIGCMIRWLDYNDTWLAAEWGHPSDNLGAILAVADHLSRKRVAGGATPIEVREVLDAAIRAYEIQGVLALDNSFNRVGLDHVLLVKVASTAVAARLMGASREQMLSALSHAWIDGQALRTYRHAPNTGSRKSWAAGDATSRGVRLADIAMREEMGVPSALTASRWGFYDVLFTKTNEDQAIKPPKERQLSFQRDFGSYVIENILFKAEFPVEFHSQTACEAARMLHPTVRERLAEIEQITVSTHESAIRIISKVGPLNNPADRDHCLQYVVAVALAFGSVGAEHFEDEWHEAHPIIDELREKIHVVEERQYSVDYHDPDKRMIANAIEISFEDGTKDPKVVVEYPVGHRRRRAEGVQLLERKFERALGTRFVPRRAARIMAVFQDQERLEGTAVNDLMDLFAI